MQTRQDISLLAAIGILALLILGATVETPLLLTLFIVGAFTLLALIIRYFAVKRDERLERFTIEQKKNRSRLTIWTQVIDSMPNACVLIDRDKRVIHANQEAQSLARIETLGRPFTSYIRGGNMTRALERALDGKPTSVVDIHKVTPAEQYLRIKLTSKTLVRNTAEQRYILAVISDVTEDKIADTQKADFLANASHELKTPIASLLGYIETLRHHAKNDPEAREKFLVIMQAQAERMVRLIDDLLSLRKIEQSEHIAPNDLTDLNQSIMAAIEALKPLADKRGVSLNYNFKGKALSLAKPDETVQLLLNLLDNALKFTPKGQEIDITIKHITDWSPTKAFENSTLSTEAPTRRIVEYSRPLDQAGVWQIRITDKGKGFAREHLPRIGERFYRIAGDLSSKEKGTGLGLAIVKHVVIRHRAGLYIRSLSEVGTEFSLVMPVVTDKNLRKNA